MKGNGRPCLKAVVEAGGVLAPPEAQVVHAQKTDGGWALDTTVLFVDDKLSADDFIEAATIEVPMALAGSVGRMDVTDLSGHLESQYVSFTAELSDFALDGLSQSELSRLELFYQLLLQ
eukprot:scaffold276550_cov26-Prasinocladus_malaysianus.AAC.1